MGPEPQPRRPLAISADDVSAAASSGSKPPSGPTTSTHSPPGGGRHPGDLLAGGIGDDQPGAAAQLRHRQRPLDLGHAGPTALGRRLARDPAQAGEGCVGAASAPNGVQNDRDDSSVTPSTPSSVSFCTASSGFVPFVSAKATTRRGSSCGSTTVGALGVEVDHAGPDAHDGIGAPTPVAVGGRERLAGADAPNSAQVMPGVVVERDVVVERGQEGVRGRRVQGRESRPLLESGANPVEEPAIGWRDFLAAQLGELTEQLFLLRARTSPALRRRGARGGRRAGDRAATARPCP